MTNAVCTVSTLWPSDEAKTAFGIGLVIIEFFIPFFVLLVCYGKIVWVLTRRINTNIMKNKSSLYNSESSSVVTVRAKPDSELADPGRDKFQLARKNTIKTLFIVGLCFIICWSQNQIIYFMYSCGYNVNFNSAYVQFTVVMVFLNCTVNPFIYLIKYRDFQEAWKQFFFCNKQHAVDISLNSSVSSPNSTSIVNC